MAVGTSEGRPSSLARSFDCVARPCLLARSFVRSRAAVTASRTWPHGPRPVPSSRIPETRRAVAPPGLPAVLRRQLAERLPDPSLSTPCNTRASPPWPGSREGARMPAPGLPWSAPLPFPDSRTQAPNTIQLHVHDPIASLRSHRSLALAPRAANRRWMTPTQL